VPPGRAAWRVRSPASARRPVDRAGPCRVRGPVRCADGGRCRVRLKPQHRFKIPVAVERDTEHLPLHTSSCRFGPTTPPRRPCTPGAALSRLRGPKSPGTRLCRARAAASPCSDVSPRQQTWRRLPTGWGLVRLWAAQPSWAHSRGPEQLDRTA
jgi:hypothetical protein